MSIFDKVFVLILLGSYFECGRVSAEDEGEIMARLAEVMGKIQLIDSKVQALVGNEDAQTLLDKMDLKLDTVNANLDRLLGQKVEAIESNRQIIDGDTDREDENLRPSDGTKLGPDEKNVVIPVGSFSEQEPIRLYSLVRNRTGHAENTFTIRLKKNTDDMFFRVQDGMGMPQVPEVTEDGEISSVSFKLGNTSETMQDPWFMASDTDHDHFVALKLNNSFEDGVVSFEFGDIPEVQISPFREVAYGPEEDVTIEVEVIRADYTSRGGYGDEVDGFFFGVDLNTSEFYNFFGNEEWFNKTDDLDPEPDKIKQIVTVMTSKHPLSGHYSLSFHVPRNESELVKHMQISRYILIRPSNQRGAFPPGYLSFVDQPHLEKSEDGRSKTFCRVGLECPITCQAVGENVTSIQVVQVLSDEDIAEVPTAQMLPADYDHTKAIVWKFKAERDSGDVDGIATFRCMAFDQVHRRSIIKYLDVQAYIESKVINEKSGVRIRNNKMDSFTKDLTFTCYVEGRPLPNITFSAGSTPIPDLSDYGTPSVPVVADGNITGYAVKKITMSKSEFRSVRKHIREGYYQQLPYCEAIAEGNWVADKFEFDLS